MKKLILFFLITQNIFAQDIKWNIVDSDEIDPPELDARGIIILNNGDETPEVDLTIDFDNKFIYYKDPQNKSLFSLTQRDFKKVSITNVSEPVSSLVFFYEVGSYVRRLLRKDLFNNENLNEIEVASVKKKNFLHTGKPRFEYTNNTLNVTNMRTIKSKVLSISPSIIEYFDSDGDVWYRNNKKARNITGLDKIEEISDEKKENANESFFQKRILNIKFGDKYFLNTRELYNYFFREYRNRFYESIEKFKKELIGEHLIDILIDWGPFTEQYKIDSNNTLYIWNETLLVTDKEMSSFGSSNSNTLSKSTNTGVGYWRVNLFGNVLKSNYDLSGNSFLKYYTRNTNKSTSNTLNTYAERSIGSDITTDQSRKIAIIVDENQKIKEVILKNYFTYPEYGVKINFIE